MKRQYARDTVRAALSIIILIIYNIIYDLNIHLTTLSRFHTDRE